jgi:hypothetical protein
MFSYSKKHFLSGILFLISLGIFGQSPLVEVYGNVTDDNTDLVGVLIQVTQGSRVIVSTKTDPNGEYAFQLPLGGEYLAEVSREGYISKKFTISTVGVPPEKVDKKFQPIGASISLFRRMEGVDYSLLNQPMMKFRYNTEEESFEFDKAYQAQMSAGMEQIKEAEKELKRVAKEKEARYALLVKEGDKAFGKKDYQASINNYREALTLKPKESYPQAQITHISKLMQDAEALAKADAGMKAKLAADAAAKKAADDAAAKAKADLEAAAKAKADKELADKLAREKADADAKAKAAADAKAKADADALAKKQADEAALKAKLEAEAQKRKQEEDALARKKAEELAARDKAEAERLAKEKAEADKKASEALAKKNADDAAAKAKADKELADKLAKEKASNEEKARLDKLAQEKAKADSEAKAKADKELADKNAREKAKADADAKARADKELADKLAKEKAEADKKSADELAKKLAADAQKKNADEAASKAKADKELADKLAADKAAADAKVKAEKELADKLAKEKADKEAADKAAKEKEALAKAEADAKLKAEADRLAKEKLTADASKGKNDKNILPVLGADDTKYKEAIRKGDNFLALKRYRDAKRCYEEALVQKSGDAYATEKLMEVEKLINSDANQITDERQKQLLAKYPEGVTEETIPGEGVVIIRRVLVRNRVAYVFEKKIFNWGGIACFRDGTAITELVFEQETKK